jgi:hypothetical protein
LLSNSITTATTFSSSVCIILQEPKHHLRHCTQPLTLQPPLCTHVCITQPQLLQLRKQQLLLLLSQVLLLLVGRPALCSPGSTTTRPYTQPSGPHMRPVVHILVQGMLVVVVLA